ncbi:MAG: hypothetical protein ACHREM_24690, partial [Polyangiales bacterium]
MTPTAAREVEGGTLFDLSIPPGAHALFVEGGAVRAKLALTDLEALPTDLIAAQRARDAGKLDEALAILARSSGAFGDRAITIAIGLRARVALQRSEEQAPGLFEEAIARHTRAGRLSEAAGDAFALVFALQRAHRLTEARRVLDEASRSSPGYPDARARATYYGALLAEDAGDFRAALRGLAIAERGAQRIGFVRLARVATQERASLLVTLGRADD